MTSNSEIATRFAEGATAGKGSNVFIEGNAIYSWGNHFPIAVRLAGGKYLFNTDSYSSSTRKHQYYVRSALIEYNVIEGTTKDLQRAISYDATEAIVVEKTIMPTSIPEMERTLVAFFKEQGMGRRASTRSKKFIAEMRQLLVLENV